MESNAKTTTDAATALGSPRLVLGGMFGMETAEKSAARLEAFVAAGGRFVETAPGGPGWA